MSELDEYIKDTASLFISTGRASVGLIQRKFNIGFNRANRIMNQLQDLGAVGEEDGFKPRKILCNSYAEFEALLDSYLKYTEEPEPYEAQGPTTSHSNFDRMSGTEFEEFCRTLLYQNGFENVETTQASADRGVDIIAYRDDISYAIQCKCYSSPVGNKAVQEAYSGKRIYDTDIAVVLTNSTFTEQAREDAQKLRVKLWGRDKLLKLIAAAAKAKSD